MRALQLGDLARSDQRFGAFILDNSVPGSDEERGLTDRVMRD